MEIIRGSTGSVNRESGWSANPRADLSTIVSFDNYKMRDRIFLDI
ncbi:MAG TPA: hypothetical protein VFC07_10925 [Verrucomicrobiae bacterium]|nr:hypothetical protein [Verrucomicrobiae bacterium]